ncbi:MAG: 2,4-diaminopentanoate dehydrogenase [Bacillota bacterium]
MEKIKVVLWGLGSMGSGMGRILAKKEGVELVGGIDTDPKKLGKDLGDLLNIEEKLDVEITDDPELVLSEDVDLVLLATSSFLKDVEPQLKLIIQKGINVISIAEEMAYPMAGDNAFASEIDRLARENDVSVLGTGINPGFVLDLMIIALSGVCGDVKKIEASRINDLSPFGPTVMKTQGVGTTVEEFEQGIEAGTIVGHIGFKESIHMIADRLGIKLDEIRETREPIVSETHRKTEHVTVEPGMVAGCKHIAKGFYQGEEIIVLNHPQQIHPEIEDVETGDYIKIYGDPEVNMAISPEIPGGKGTMGVAVNMIPHVIKAVPGLHTMADLPVPGAVMTDMRELI